jgi:hypothetical protein
MIKESLSEKTIFLTGATGFLVQPLVEKILWSSLPELPFSKRSQPNKIDTFHWAK